MARRRRSIDPRRSRRFLGGPSPVPPRGHPPPGGPRLSGARSSRSGLADTYPIKFYFFTSGVQGAQPLGQIFLGAASMIDNSKRTGAAVEAHYRFLVWLAPTVEKFPRGHKFTIGDRIEALSLDVLESLI